MKNKKKKSLLRRLSSYDDIKNTFLITKNVIEKEKKELKKEQISETFEEALLRFGITEENKNSKLNNIYKKIRLESILMCLFGFLTLTLTTYNLINNPDFLILYAFYIISLTMFMKSFYSSYRCFQIRKESLEPLKEYLKKPKEWIPKKHEKKDIEKKGDLDVIK